MNAPSTVTLNELIHARQVAAKVVKLHGAKYLPIFQRFEREIQQLQSGNDALERALKLAEG